MGGWVGSNQLTCYSLVRLSWAVTMKVKVKTRSVKERKITSIKILSFGDFKSIQLVPLELGD